MKFMNTASVVILCASATLLAGCGKGKPDGISEEAYRMYKMLDAPKILYSCRKMGLDKERARAMIECLKLTDPDERISCTEKVGFGDIVRELVYVDYTTGAGGFGYTRTYNQILDDEKTTCGKGEFKIIDSKS